MNRFLSIFAVFSICLAALDNVALAGPGHDHGDKAPLAASGPVSPRFEAHSDLFEIVGVLGDAELSVFVDRFDDNAPVLKAKVELESGNTKALGQFHEEHGDYSFDAASFQKPGDYPITLTVAVGEDVDILAANLMVPDTHAKHEHEESSLLKQLGLWALGLVILAALVWTAKGMVERRNAGATK